MMSDVTPSLHFSGSIYYTDTHIIIISTNTHITSVSWQTPPADTNLNLRMKNWRFFWGLVEISPLCVLDFYVVEGHQRGGMGRQLFDQMLSREDVKAERLGYDRPSPKLIGFLRQGW